jgi:hypothetical protein
MNQKQLLRQLSQALLPHRKGLLQLFLLLLFTRHAWQDFGSETFCQRDEKRKLLFQFFYHLSPSVPDTCTLSITSSLLAQAKIAQNLAVQEIPHAQHVLFLLEVFLIDF